MADEGVDGVVGSVVVVAFAVAVMWFTAAAPCFMAALMAGGSYMLVCVVNIGKKV